LFICSQRSAISYKNNRIIVTKRKGRNPCMCLFYNCNTSFLGKNTLFHSHLSHTNGQSYSSFPFLKGIRRKELSIKSSIGEGSFSRGLRKSPQEIFHFIQLFVNSNMCISIFREDISIKAWLMRENYQCGMKKTHSLKLLFIRFISLTLCIAWGIIPESVIGKGSLGNVTATIQTALVSKFGSLLFLFLFS